MKTHNPNCDGDHCMSQSGPVRVLPTGGDGNAILCRACFDHEIAYRHDRNRELKAARTGTSFDLPQWNQLKEYAL